MGFRSPLPRPKPPVGKKPPLGAPTAGPVPPKPSANTPQPPAKSC
jgi:hypothetical protein